jgi:hypothetical protein
LELGRHGEVRGEVLPRRQLNGRAVPDVGGFDRAEDEGRTLDVEQRERPARHKREELGESPVRQIGLDLHLQLCGRQAESQRDVGVSRRRAEEALRELRRRDLKTVVDDAAHVLRAETDLQARVRRAETESGLEGFVETGGRGQTRRRDERRVQDNRLLRVGERLRQALK